MKKQRFKYPSVTEILEPYVDLSMVKPAVLKAAQVRGNIVHNVCHGHTKFGFSLNIPPQYRGYLKSFEYFHRDLIKIELIEKRIYNDAVRLCGQPDLVARRIGDQHERVWDLKTPSAVYSTWKGQIAAYKWLYEQATGRVTDMPGHVRLREDGRPPLITVLDPDAYKTELEMFFNILTAHHHYL